ncbi:MAG: rhodanese-like domain-containing protein [Rhizobiaceae bacterium]
MPIVPVKELVERANKQVTTLSAAEAGALATGGQAMLVDIRDIRELDREGRVDGAFHAPRGMLEFWFDPQSPYHKDVFADESRTFVLFCAAGWRSALAAKTLEDMGFTNIAHVDGGFGALKQSGIAITVREK